MFFAKFKRDNAARIETMLLEVVEEEIHSMTKTTNKRWSYAEDRCLIQLAASSKSLAVADVMKRTPERAAQMAMRLGVSPKSDTGPKAK